MESIDDLLAKVKAEYQEQEQNLLPQKKPLFDAEEFKSQAPNQSTTYQSQSKRQNCKSTVEDSLLAQVKAEFDEQQRVEELEKQQQLQEEKLRAKQKEQKKREALTQEATEWLKKLNFHSEEGLWFEEFSYSYPSKLEAAIDYLQALRDTHH